MLLLLLLLEQSHECELGHVGTGQVCIEIMLIISSYPVNECSQSFKRFVCSCIAHPAARPPRRVRGCECRVEVGSVAAPRHAAGSPPAAAGAAAETPAPPPARCPPSRPAPITGELWGHVTCSPPITAHLDRLRPGQAAGGHAGAHGKGAPQHSCNIRSLHQSRGLEERQLQLQLGMFAQSN